MKKLLLTTSIVALSFLDAFAGDGKSFKEVKTVVVPEPPCRFRDMEWQIDAFYSHFWGDAAVTGGPGGGFGVNFFFLRYVGIGYEASWFDNDGVAFHLPVGGNLFLRYPICALNLAPYILVGGGAAWDGDVTVTEMSEAVLSIASPIILVSLSTDATFTAARMVLAILPTFVQGCGLRSNA